MALAANSAYLAVALGIEVWVFEKSSGKTVLQHTNVKDPESKSPSEPFVSTANFSKTDFYIGDYGKRVQRFTIPDFELKEAKTVDKKITHIEPYEKHILAATKAGLIEVFDFTEDEMMNRLRNPCGHLMTVLDVKLVDWTPPDDPSDAGALMISCGVEKKIWVNRFPKSYIIESFAFGHEAFVCKLALAEPDMFISGSADGSVRVWDMKGREKCKVKVAETKEIDNFAVVGLSLLEETKEKDKISSRTLFVSTNQKQESDGHLNIIQRWSLSLMTGQLTKVGETELKEAGEVLATYPDSSSGIWVLVTTKPHLRYVGKDGKVLLDIACLAKVNEELSKKEVDTDKLPRFWQDFDRIQTKRVGVAERKRQVQTKRVKRKKNMNRWGARKKRRKEEQRGQWEKGSDNKKQDIKVSG